MVIRHFAGIEMIQTIEGVENNFHVIKLDRPLRRQGKEFFYLVILPYNGNEYVPCQTRADADACIVQWEVEHGLRESTPPVAARLLIRVWDSQL